MAKISQYNAQIYLSNELESRSSYFSIIIAQKVKCTKIIKQNVSQRSHPPLYKTIHKTQIATISQYNSQIYLSHKHESRSSHFSVNLANRSFKNRSLNENGIFHSVGFLFGIKPNLNNKWRLYFLPQNNEWTDLITDLLESWSKRTTNIQISPETSKLSPTLFVSRIHYKPRDAIFKQIIFREK